MPELFFGDNDARVIVRHTGAPGVGIPTGGIPGQILVKTGTSNYATQWTNPPNGTGAVTGPVSSVDNNVAVFNGTTGELIKDSGKLLSSYATLLQLALKQDKVTGKGLSQEDFTTLLKDKLDSLVEHFRGTYATADDVDDIVDPIAGDYALVEGEDDPQTVSFWDATNDVWNHNIKEELTGQSIADALFDPEDAEVYDQEECRIFTSDEKAQLVQFQAAFDALGAGNLVRPFGSMNYFNLTGTLVAIAAVSDGQTNMVKVDVPTALGSSLLSFDAGTSTARLRYTGTTTKVFNVTAVVSADLPVNDAFVFGVAKNGSVSLTSRVLHKSAVAGAANSVALSAQVSMSLNDYLEVFVGNVTNTDDLTVHSLRLDATPT